jgi:tRNA 2-thiouridine synthesizing protein A
MERQAIRQTLDLTGLKCPLPALFAKRALLRAPAGTEIEVIADDPMAIIDVPHMCRQEGFVVVSEARDGDVCRVVVRR